MIRNLIFIVLIMLFLAFCLNSQAQNTLSVDTNVNPATIPSDANYKAHARWNIRCAERVGAMAGKSCNALFIGDSITQNFSEDKDGTWNITDFQILHLISGERGFDLTGRSVWSKYYDGRGFLDFGVGADGTEHILWRMENMDIRQLSPKVVVILAGTNDIKRTPAQIAEGVRTVLDKARSFYPNAHFLIMSLTPRSGYLDKVIAVNIQLQKLGDNDRVFYMDLFSKMTPVGNSWVGIGHDHVHLTPEGYELWAQTIEPILQRFCPKERKSK